MRIVNVVAYHQVMQRKRKLSAIGSFRYISSKFIATTRPNKNPEQKQKEKDDPRCHLFASLVEILHQNNNADKKNDNDNKRRRRRRRRNALNRRSFKRFPSVAILKLIANSSSISKQHFPTIFELVDGSDVEFDFHVYQALLSCCPLLLMLAISSSGHPLMLLC